MFGLTGGIASGKSTVARFFGALGASVIDADRIGHELIHSSTPVYRKVVARFGLEILDACGEIDRRRLGSIVFADPLKLAELNSIVHPILIARIAEISEEIHSRRPQAVILVDGALIYEAAIADRFAKIVVAWCAPEQQVERLIAKTGLPREEALRRIAAQIPAEEKRRRADYVIDCSGSLEETQSEVEALYPEFQRLAEK